MHTKLVTQNYLPAPSQSEVVIIGIDPRQTQFLGKPCV